MAGVGLLPVVMNTVAGPCDGMVWYSERTMVALSMTWAIFGRCSLICTPAALVLMGLNSPRMPSGALGLRSHMSMVAGPPASQTMMTELALRLAGERRVLRLRLQPEQFRQAQSEQAGRPDFQEVAAVEAFTFVCCVVIGYPPAPEAYPRAMAPRQIGQHDG